MRMTKLCHKVGGHGLESFSPDGWVLEGLLVTVVHQSGTQDVGWVKPDCVKRWLLKDKLTNSKRSRGV